MARKRIDITLGREMEVPNKSGRGINYWPHYEDPKNPGVWKKMSSTHANMYYEWKDKKNKLRTIKKGKKRGPYKKSKSVKVLEPSAKRRLKGQFLKGTNLSRNQFGPLHAKSNGIVFKTERYFNKDGKAVADSGRRWGAHVGKGDVSKYGGTNVLKNFKEMARHLEIAAYKVALNADRFRVVMLHKAEKIFQTSFKYKKFYTSDSTPWPALAPYTIKKRMKRGTGNRILNEYGDLKRSLTVDEDKHRLTTEEVQADPKKHKNHTRSYAGWHNEGEGFYPRSGTRYKKRQFMGHSSYLDPMINRDMARMVKLYFFDDVFLTKSATHGTYNQ